MITTALNQDPNDSLDDLLGARTDSPKPAAAPPATYQPREITEPCAKCRGTGTFYGRNGRAFGPCFTCKGAGKKTFKTSSATRAANRESRARSDQRKVELVREQFLAEHGDVARYVLTSSDSFAMSLLAKLDRVGSLLPGAIEAVQRILDKRAVAKAEAEERAAAAPVVTMDAIERAFDAARARRADGNTRLKLRFAGVTFSAAKAGSKNPGALYAKRDGVYLGKIMGGRFLASRDCDDATSAQVIEIARDPKAAAIAHGKLTGTCSCCGRELTDPDSIAQGIGPICAINFGW